MNAPIDPERRLAETSARLAEAERALGDARRRHEEFLDSIEGIVWEAEAEPLRFLYVSRQAERLLGYPRAYWTEEPDFWVRHLHPEDLDWASEFCRRQTAAGANHEFEYRMVAADGHVVWLRDIVTVVVRDGTPVGLRGIMVDVTQRRNADQALRESEERFRAAFEQAAVGMAVVGRDGEILRANECLCRMSGYTRDELLSRTLASVTHPEDLETDRELARRLLRGEIPTYSVEKRYLRRDGGTLRAALTVSLVRRPDGETNDFLGVVEDVGEKKRTEEFSQKLLRAVEQTENMIFMTDRAGQITYVNPAFTAVYGYTREEALGKTPRILKSGRYEEPFYRAIWTALLSGDGYRGEIVNRRKDGTFVTAEASANPVNDPDGHPIGFVGVQTDVSRRKQLEEQLRQTQKMDAVGRLAGGVAHDFNNLLTAILGYCDLALGQLGETDPLREELGEIRKAAERAAGLTRQLLTFSRKHVVEPKVLDLNLLVSESTAMLRRLIGEDVELVTRLDPAVGRVRADAVQLQQVLLNLAVNARDAMPQGGRLTIATRPTGRDEALPAVLADRGRSFVTLEVADTGTGIEPGTLERVFEPFFTTKEPGRGTGLGLSIAYGIVKQSGGEILVSSEMGKGTSLGIYLPSVEAIADQVTPVRLVSPVAARRTIVLAEDEESVRTLTRRVLEEIGYTVLPAANADEALLLAERHEGPIDLLLTDVIMPGGSGPELAQQLRRRRPGTKVLFVSGYTDSLVHREGILEREFAYLQKPFTAETLARKVREVLEETG